MRNTETVTNVSKAKGFTLIELLVVISIISLLSSIVIASVNSARTRAVDASLKSLAMEFRKLLEFDYDERGNYDNLQQTGWIQSADGCDSIFDSGNYYTQARVICRQMYQSARHPTLPASPSRVYFAAQPTGGAIDIQKWSIMIGLPGSLKWYCLGNSGRSGEYLDYNNQPGCWNNP